MINEARSTLSIHSTLASKWKVRLQGAGQFAQPRWIDLQTVSSSAYHLRIGLVDDGYVLEIAPIGCFIILPASHEIVVVPTQDATHAQLQHLLDNAVVPRLLTLSGYLTFHASVIATEAFAIAFLGESGVGKSTLASSLSRAGYAIIADDCLTLSTEGGRLAVVPNLSDIRLWNDSLEWIADNAIKRPTHQPGKHSIRIKNARPLPSQRLQSIYLVEPQAADAAISIQQVTSGEAFKALMLTSFRLALENGNQIAHEFKWVTKLVNEVPVKRLRVPRDFVRLPAVHAALEADWNGKVNPLGITHFGIDLTSFL